MHNNKQESSSWNEELNFSSSGWCGSGIWAPACELKGHHSIPGQSTCLGCGPGSPLGACQGQPVHVSLTHQCFSPSLSPSLPLSKISIKSFLKICPNIYHLNNHHHDKQNKSEQKVPVGCCYSSCHCKSEAHFPVLGQHPQDADPAFLWRASFSKPRGLHSPLACHSIL